MWLVFLVSLLSICGIVSCLSFTFGNCFSIELPQESKITQDRVEFNSNPKFANVSAVVWDERDHSYCNVFAENFVDVENMILNMKLAIPKNDKDKKYGNEVVKASIETCKLAENRNNFLVKILLDSMEKNADFKLTCPFPKVKLTAQVSGD